MERNLVIGEYVSLGTYPYFFPLRNVFNEPNWVFVSGSPAQLEDYLHQGEVDVALVSPLSVVSAPRDFLVMPDVGYAANRHVREILLFSDMLLEDMDEMSVSLQSGALTSAAMIRIVLDNYLQYQNQYIEGWGSAESFVLEGDPALRERVLARYSYVYDMGDLWKHYTKEPMIYYLWVVRRQALQEKEEMVVLFYRMLRHAIQVSSSDWNRLALLMQGYDWIKKPMIHRLWNHIEYVLKPEHFRGLERFFEDCLDTGIIEETPALCFFEPEES
ncbi:MAG: MqnA/MqnD/SBP family protein [bacterium]